MSARRGLGVRIEKEKSQRWPTATWAVVDEGGVVAHGRAQAPKTYDEAAALRHVLEAIESAVREHGATRALVWTIEGNAKINNAMRPRLRVEGAACAAAASAGASSELVAWPEISSMAAVPTDSKATITSASKVCGLDVGEADPYAVLAAVAARKSEPKKG